VCAQDNPTPDCPVPDAAGSGADRRGFSLNRKHLFVAGRIQDPAYLSIGVTSSSGTGLCGVSGVGDSRGIGARVCEILHVNFREFQFHALR
jgi:hypothetical protein